MLNEIDHIGFQPPQRFVDLAGGELFRPPVDLRHQKNLFALTVFQKLAHPLFAFAFVCNPSNCQKA